jgi:hypothetical protein
MVRPLKGVTLERSTLHLGQIWHLGAKITIFGDLETFWHMGKSFWVFGKWDIKWFSILPQLSFRPNYFW